MSHRIHHSHNQYDKMRLNAGTNALVKLARMTVPLVLLSAYAAGVYAIFHSFANASERKGLEAKTTYSSREAGK